MKTLRARIREAVDRADRRLAQPEILAQCVRGGAVIRNVFCVTIAQMLGDRQLDRRKATKAVRALNPGVRFVYGPGRVPVLDENEGRAPKKMMGFMEMKRLRAARAAARRRCA